ncbi:MAG: hypothetical protein IKE22_05135, partial [Atopobiaceae bacterium]|nr:hypothetical protein [Atopobiaceae bacterium]
GGFSESVLCTDEDVLAQLKNDLRPEFVLDGRYYTLPAPLSAFTEHGWTMTVDDYEGQEVILQPGERVGVTLEKGHDTLEAIIVNDGNEPLEAGDACNVIQVRLYASREGTSPKLFVTKYGITPLTSQEQVREILQDKEGFTESGDMLYLTVEGEMGMRDILYFRQMDDFTSMKVESAGEYQYRLYKPQEQKAQEQAEKVAAYKEDAERECLSDYSEIIKTLRTKATVPFYSAHGTILSRSVGNYEGTEGDLLRGGDLSLYVVKDASGQLYCIYEGYANYDSKLRLPELAEGEVISTWGFASQVTTFDDGTSVPTVIPKIVEKNGEIIYLAEELQVN